MEELILKAVVNLGVVGIAAWTVYMASRAQMALASAEKDQQRGTMKLAGSIDGLVVVNTTHANAYAALQKEIALSTAKRESIWEEEREQRLMQNQGIMDVINQFSIQQHAVIKELIDQLATFTKAADSIALNFNQQQASNSQFKVALDTLAGSIDAHTTASRNDAALLSAHTQAVKKMTDKNEQLTNANEELVKQLRPVLEELRQLREEISQFRQEFGVKANDLEGRLDTIENRLTATVNKQPKPAIQKESPNV